MTPYDGRISISLLIKSTELIIINEYILQIRANPILHNNRELRYSLPKFYFLSKKHSITWRNFVKLFFFFFLCHNFHFPYIAMMFYIRTGIYTVSLSSRVRHLNTHFKEHTEVFAHFMAGMQTLSHKPNPQIRLEEYLKRIKDLSLSFVYFQFLFGNIHKTMKIPFIKIKQGNGRDF